MKTILVTGIGQGGIGEQILKALRIAENKQTRLVGCDCKPNTKSNLVQIVELLPPANSIEYITSLGKIVKKYEVDAILPGSEPELKAISKSRQIFEKNNIFLPINDQNVLDTCFDKLKLNKFLKNNGFNFPKYMEVNSHEDLDAIDWFPVVIKPKSGTSGSSNVFIAQTKNELKGLGLYLGLDNKENGFFIQEYVGTPEGEFTVGVLSDLDGKIINSIGLNRNLTKGISVKEKVKNKTGNLDLGKFLVISSGISQGDIRKYEEVTFECEKISLALKSKGPLNIQCRLYKDKIYVFEINPRFSGTTSVRAMVGFNEPDLLIRKYLFGEDIPKSFAFNQGEICRNLVEELVL